MSNETNIQWNETGEAFDHVAESWVVGLDPANNFYSFSWSQPLARTSYYIPLQQKQLKK